MAGFCSDVIVRFLPFQYNKSRLQKRIIRKRGRIYEQEEQTRLSDDFTTGSIAGKLMKFMLPVLGALVLQVCTERGSAGGGTVRNR